MTKVSCLFALLTGLMVNSVVASTHMLNPRDRSHSERVPINPLIMLAFASPDNKNLGDSSLWGPVPTNAIVTQEDISSDIGKQGERMKFFEDAAKGTLTLMDGGVPVLTYRFGDQLKEGVDPKFARSSYIHPLYGLDGQPLTDDFPADHVHHHALFWGWPRVKVRGQTTNNWEVGEPPLRQLFVRWLKRAKEGPGAALSVENIWKLDNREVVASEIVTFRVNPADSVGRTIDLELLITAVGGPLELQGTLDQNKGYGGLCFRSAPLLKGARMTTDKGVLNEDAVNTPFLWADISTDELGIAIFGPPGHPDAPLHWLIRNSYAGVINPSWPGLKPVTLSPGQPVALRYRIYIHRGDAAAGKVAEKYRLYYAAR